MAIGDEEELVRALHEPFWDAHNQRATKSAFTQSDVSVSRISILAYEEIVAIFQHDLNRTSVQGKPARRVEASATVDAGAIRAECAANTAADVCVDIVIDPVVGDPIQIDNPAHALIQGRDRKTKLMPKKLSAGMANAILKKCLIRVIDT